jgi:hypothetical protein
VDVDLKQDEAHAAQVDSWIVRTAKGLPADQTAALFEEVIHAIRKRTSITLSEITLTAIFDRVLYKSQRKFPLLAGLKIDAKGISLDGNLSQIESQDPARITEAFRFFVIELLTILENLTAGILTKALYKEMHKVTGQTVSQESKASPRNINHPKRRTDREDS